MAFKRIAEAYVELRASGEGKVKASIGAIRTELKGLKKDGDDALGRLGDRMDKSTEGARKLQGAIGGVLGIVIAVAAAFYKAGNVLFKFIDGMEDGEKKARRFVDALGDRTIENAPERLAAIREEQEKLNALLADDSIFGWWDKVWAGGEENVRRQKDELNELGNLAAEQIRQQREAEQRAEEERRRAQEEEEDRRIKAHAAELQRQNELINAERVGGPQARELVSLAQQRADIERELAEAQDAGQIELLRALRERLRLIENLRKDTLASIEEEKQAAKQAAKEKADVEIEERRRVARETAAANAAAIDQLAQRQADAIASVIDANSQQFARLTDLMAVAVDRLEVIRRNTKQ